MSETEERKTSEPDERTTPSLSAPTPHTTPSPSGRTSIGEADLSEGLQSLVPETRQIPTIPEPTMSETEERNTSETDEPTPAPSESPLSRVSIREMDDGSLSDRNWEIVHAGYPLAGDGHPGLGVRASHRDETTTKSETSESEARTEPAGAVTPTNPESPTWRDRLAALVTRAPNSIPQPNSGFSTINPTDPEIQNYAYARHASKKRKL